MLAHRYIERRMLRQVLTRKFRAGHAVREARAIIHIGRSEGLPRQRSVESNVQRVALVVIEWRVSGWRLATGIGRRKADQPTGDGTSLVSDLIRVGQVKLTAIPESRRCQGQLPATNQSTVDRHRNKNIRIADVVVVEKVIRARLEVVGIERPTPEGNGHAKLV